MSSPLPDLRWKRLALPLAILTLTVGALAAINTWDYPTYLLLAVGAVLLASYVSHRRLDRTLLASAALRGGLVAVLSYAAFLPFHLRNVTFDAGVHASAQQTDIHHYLAIHGLFLFVILSYLAYEGRKYLGRLTRSEHSLGTQQAVPPTGIRASFLSNPFMPVAAAVFIILTAYLIAAGYATVALLFLMTVVVMLLGVGRLTERDSEARSELLQTGRSSRRRMQPPP